MSKKYPCVYHDNGKCQKFSDDQYNAWCVNGPCEDQVMSNADHIRSMTDEELADYMSEHGIENICYRVCGGDCNAFPTFNKTSDQVCREIVSNWLKQPYKEDT